MVVCVSTTWGPLAAARPQQGEGCNELGRQSASYPLCLTLHVGVSSHPFLCCSVWLVCFVLFCFGLCLFFCVRGLFSPAFCFALCCFVLCCCVLFAFVCCIEGPRSAPLPSRPVPSPPLSSPSSLSPRPPSVYFLAAATSHRRAGHGGAQRRARLSRLEQLLRRSLHSCWLEGPLGRAQPVGIDRKAPGAAHNMAVNRFFAELPPVAC